MSPRLSSTVKQIVRKKQADFGPFLVRTGSRCRASRVSSARGEAQKPPLARLRHCPCSMRAYARFPRRYADQGPDCRCGRARRRAAVSKKKPTRATGGVGRAAAVRSRPDDLGRLTAENAWSHDGSLRNGPNHMIFLANSEWGPVASALEVRRGRRGSWSGRSVASAVRAAPTPVRWFPPGPGAT